MGLRRGFVGDCCMLYLMECEGTLDGLAYGLTNRELMDSARERRGKPYLIFFALLCPVLVVPLFIFWLVRKFRTQRTPSVRPDLYTAMSDTA